MVCREEKGFRDLGRADTLDGLALLEQEDHEGAVASNHPNPNKKDIVYSSLGKSGEEWS